MDVNTEEVASVMHQQRVKALVHGHTHRPARHQLLVDKTPSTRWVLGDWHPDGAMYVRLDGGALSLCEFTPDSPV